MTKRPEHIRTPVDTISPRDILRAGIAGVGTVAALGSTIMFPPFSTSPPKERATFTALCPDGAEVLVNSEPEPVRVASLLSKVGSDTFASIEISCAVKEGRREAPVVVNKRLGDCSDALTIVTIETEQANTSRGRIPESFTQRVGSHVLVGVIGNIDMHFAGHAVERSFPIANRIGQGDVYIPCLPTGSSYRP